MMTYCGADSYDGFVVVAEEEWKIHYDMGEAEADTQFSTRIGNFKWLCSFKGHEDVCLECQEVSSGFVKEIQAEVVMLYQTSNSAQFSTYMQVDSEFNFLLIIRILAPRSEFPDFNGPNSAGKLASNGKFVVGEKIYHINKELLSWHSPYFERMFNGDYAESSQDAVKLELGEIANPEMFEDFLLAIYPSSNGQNEALPNYKNVVDLLKFAKYFQVDSVHQKCVRHLMICREIGVEDRILLANKFGMAQVQTQIVHEINSLDQCKQVLLKFLNANEG